MNPTIKLVAAFAVGFAIPAMAASNQTWYATHALKPKPCAAVEKGPLGAPYTILNQAHKAAGTCATD